MAWRMHSYVHEVWRSHTAHRGQHVDLPAVLPVVVFQGPRPWANTTDLLDLISHGQTRGTALEAYQPRLQYLLVDLGNKVPLVFEARRASCDPTFQDQRVLTRQEAAHPSCSGFEIQELSPDLQPGEEIRRGRVVGRHGGRPPQIPSTATMKWMIDWPSRCFLAF